MSVLYYISFPVECKRERERERETTMFVHISIHRYIFGNCIWYGIECDVNLKRRELLDYDRRGRRKRIWWKWGERKIKGISRFKTEVVWGNGVVELTTLHPWPLSASISPFTPSSLTPSPLPSLTPSYPPVSLPHNTRNKHKVEYHAR